MDVFTYNNIFDTKGIEYLIIIGFLLLIVPFWIFINRRTEIVDQIKKELGILSASVFKIPLGLFYSRSHTWAHLEKSGLARIGIDDFLQHVTGEFKFEELRTPGTFIKKGGVMARLDQNGKQLQIFSPISGMITRTNTSLIEEPGLINEDPYGKGWIYMVRPLEWVAETNSYFLAEEAISWTGSEFERLKDFLAVSAAKSSPEPSKIILQDGGEIRDQPLSHMPGEVWNDFQNSFLNAST
jgi:glycine cleavage system H protein